MKYFLILLFTYNSLSAQKMQKPIIDKLTGDTSIGTDRVTLYRKTGAGQAGEKLEALVYKSHGNTFLTMIGRTGKTDGFIFNQNDEMSIKLSDNSVVTLKNMQQSVPKTEIQPSFGQYWNTVYLLDNETKTKLSNSDITYIRINHSSGYLEYDIKNKMSDLVGKCVALVN